MCSERVHRPHRWFFLLLLFSGASHSLYDYESSLFLWTELFLFMSFKATKAGKESSVCQDLPRFLQVSLAGVLEKLGSPGCKRLPRTLFSNEFLSCFDYSSRFCYSTVPSGTEGSITWFSTGRKTTPESGILGRCNVSGTEFTSSIFFQRQTAWLEKGPSWLVEKLLHKK